MQGIWLHEFEGLTHLNTAEWFLIPQAKILRLWTVITMSIILPECDNCRISSRINCAHVKKWLHLIAARWQNAALCCSKSWATLNFPLPSATLKDCIFWPESVHTAAHIRTRQPKNELIMNLVYIYILHWRLRGKVGTGGTDVITSLTNYSTRLNRCSTDIAAFCDESDI